ncbi:MAG TPA: hypothetical protein VFY51_01090 [Pyrinomonadaceae bacterium]|nr:hypothetical protein [Pyrinomonadaceae bacterium]
MPDDRDNEPIDPPDNQGGGSNATATASGLESASSGTDEAPIDPPDNQGGGN